MIPKSTTPSLRQSLSSRLFYRLTLVALPGILAVIVVGAAGLLAFNTLGRQSAAVQAARTADTTARSLAGRMDSLITNLDQLTVPGNQYNTLIYIAGRSGVMSDTQTLQNLDLSFAPETQLLRDSIVRDLGTTITELDRVNSPTSLDLNARYMQWAGGTRERVVQNNTAIHRLAERWQAAAQSVSQDTNRLFDLGRGGILLLIVFTVTASLLTTTLFAHNVMRPISRLGNNMERLAAGDLTLPHTLAPQSNRTPHDELEALEGVYGRTIGTLRPLILHIQEDVGRISQSAGKIAVSAGQQDQDSSEQATAITEVTVTVEELNQTAVQIADAAARVVAVAEQALLSAGHGQDAVRDSIIGMAMIRSRVNDITSRILALSAQSQRISEIIDLIDTMAGQTHILALNAAVESAGAGGEVGERFGVVASEVKKLAQRSAAATREVRAVIAQVQAATNAAVMATEDGLKETEKGVLLAHQSGDANENIIGMVERTAQLANAISLATQQQRTASEQVVATMREIALGTQYAVTSSRQAAEEANQLDTIAHELGGYAQNFQVDPPVTSTEPPAAGVDPPYPARGPQPVAS